MRTTLSIAAVVCLLCGCGSDIREKTKSWGTIEFKPEKWQESGAEERNQMVYSFLNQHEIEAMSPGDVTHVLGVPTTYYEYDEFPAYEILVDRTRYVMAFPVARDTQRVREPVFGPPL